MKEQSIQSSAMLKSQTKIAIHGNICKRLTETYAKKNNDYGDAFAVLRKEFPDAILVRLFDKYNRLKTLMQGAEQRVENERIEDTLLDLANYCILELVEMEMDLKDLCSLEEAPAGIKEPRQIIGPAP